MPAKGTAVWKGDLRSGTGTLTAGDSINGGYTFKYASEPSCVQRARNHA
jgi:hypothetical protein